MSDPSQGHDQTPPSEAPETAPDAANPSTPRHRTHPITPLVSGWKIVVGVVAVLTAQNIASLLEDFTLTRALIGLGILAVAVVLAIGISALSWRFTTYAVDAEGVSIHSGFLSRSRQYAPRARIESVSVERPLFARLLGLAKVRVEVAGGGDSYLDIEYIRSAEAEQLRGTILDVAAGRTAGDAPGAGTPAPAEGLSPDATASATAASDTAASDSIAPDGSTAGEAPVDESATSTASRLDDLLHDGVTEGELIAQIPTGRLVRSLLRDMSFIGGVVASIVGVVVAISLAIWQEGISPAILLALLPAAIAVPKYVLGRIEASWGFVSRFSPQGLRMRRGLANTRTDAIAAGRIQQLELRRPLLWRGPGWTAASVTVAGIEDDDENGAQAVLPVGTREELGATLGHLLTPLGTEDDLATVEHLLTAPAREIEGLRTPVRAFWIARRTEVVVLLPGALVHRTGVLTRALHIVPRDRIQQLSLDDGPLNRRLGLLDLVIGGAGDSLTLTDLPREGALELHAQLVTDARTRRRLSDRGQWPHPVLSAAVAERASTLEEER